MASRPPAETVLENLITTSAKIRALARAGYLRTEISEILQVRYSQVRQVLVDAGITDGLQRRYKPRSTPTASTGSAADADDASALVPRPPVEMVVQGLETTSERIRALARAGYLRTEISEHLSIRYSHVRNALLKAGITDGLQRRKEFRATLAPPSAAGVLAKPGITPADVLLRAGFKLLGDGSPRAEEVALNGVAAIGVGVYAIVVEGQVRYVGLIRRGPRRRVDHHRRRNVQQCTNARVKGLLQAALAAGKPVSALIVTPEPQLGNGLPGSTAQGLEAGLILLLRPEWTLRGAL